MGPVTIVFGILLGILGVALYAMSESTGITPLIPAFFGIAFILLGAAAFNEKARKHVMHVAAMVALIGFLFPAYMVVKGILLGTEWNRPLVGQALMAALCGIFLALCVKSFVDARRRRKLGQGT